MRTTKQESILEWKSSERAASRYCLVETFLTQSQIDTSRQHFHNVIYKMKKKKNEHRTIESYKLSKVALLHSYSWYMLEWVENVEHFTPG